MGKWGSEIKLALRSLVRLRTAMGFAIVAYALGIGITTAVFSLFYGVLIKPLPYPNPDELVAVYDTQPACKTCPASWEKYIDWTTRNKVFSVMGGSMTTLSVVTGIGEPERIGCVRATYTLATVFGVTPALGRWFNAQEDAPGGPKVVVLSDGYWRRKFNADRNVLGRTMTIDDEPYEIIGVMSPDFQHRRAELYMPVQRAFNPANRGNHFLATYARLKPGVTPQDAQREMVALGKTLAVEFGHNHGIDVQPYSLVVVGSVAQPLRVLMGAVSFVLLIACANVANLLLASGLARRRELAVRTALGATRWDLTRQLTIESVVLALVGGGIGLLLAEWCVHTFVTMGTAILPRATTLGIDGVVVLFAIALSLVTGVLCGLWPVLRLNSKTMGRDVREGDLRSGTQAAGRRVGNGLVVAEIALAFSLLVGAGLLVKNLIGLETQDMGFTTERLVAFDLAPTGERYKDGDRVTQFYEDLLPKLQSMPTVTSVGLTSHLPMYQFGWNGEVSLEGGNPWKANEAPLVENRWIAGEYFKTMGIPIEKGRAFDDRDRKGSTAVAIISERAANTFWPGQNPIGRRFSKGGPSNPKYEVVGVAHDVMSYGLTAKVPLEMYVPIAQESFGAMTVVLRTRADDPTTVIPAARQVVASIDPVMPLSRIQRMDDVVSQSVTQPRLISSLSSLFGGLAGLLAAVGVYGVMAYNVRRERRAFGIRLALGADPSQVRSLVIRRGLLLGAAGVLIGAFGALLLTRTLQALLTNVKPADPFIFAVTGLGLLVVTVLSGYLPARQASRTDPMIVLRSE